MSQTTTARLGLPLLEASQSQKHITHNRALTDLDSLAQLVVEALDVTTPPANPQNGACYGLGSGCVAEWSGQDSDIAAWVDGAWRFFTPQSGWVLFDRASGDLKVYESDTWKHVRGDFSNLEGVGIGASFDATNRLSVNSPAILFNHAGQDVQVKLNKSSVSDSAALLFQSNWGGRAEFGLAGNDNFSIKTSADGVSWVTAMTFEAATGVVTGDAVQATSTDGTAGKLMTVGAFGLGADTDVALISDMDSTDLRSGMYRMTAATSNRPVGTDTGVVLILRHGAAGFSQQVTFEDGSIKVRYFDGTFGDWQTLFTSNTILGTVSESSGHPTGAIMESGSNANGTFLRFADGTQICTNSGVAITSAPAAFVGSITKVGSNKLWIGRWY